MKHIVINGCMDDVCPYFSRKEHYDYNDECRCKHPSMDFLGTEVLECDDYERDYDENHNLITKTIPANCGEVGLFPDFCPLEKISER